MIDTIRELIFPPKEGSAADPTKVQAAIDAAEAELGDARLELRRLEAQGADVLLRQDEAAAVAHEEKVAAARREIRRLQAAIPRLENRLELAQSSEARERSAAALEEARKADERVSKGVAKYEKLAEQLASVLKELEQDVSARAEAHERATEEDHRLEFSPTAPPRWKEGGSIVGTRLYGSDPRIGGGRRDLTVQLPSVSRTEPFWGSTGPLDEIAPETAEAVHDVSGKLGTYNAQGKPEDHRGRGRGGAKIIHGGGVV